MTKNKQRQIAMRAARSQLRSIGCLMTIKDAEAVLDDMVRQSPDLIASQWYARCTDAQWRLFKREWKNQNWQED